jgi:hypothetical protein
MLYLARLLVLPAKLLIAIPGLVALISINLASFLMLYLARLLVLPAWLLIAITDLVADITCKPGLVADVISNQVVGVIPS